MTAYCPNASIVLVGNKIDLHHDGQPTVSLNEGNLTAERIGAVAHKRCSARTQENVLELFDYSFALAE